MIRFLLVALYAHIIRFSHARWLYKGGWVMEKVSSSTVGRCLSSLDIRMHAPYKSLAGCFYCASRQPKSTFCDALFCRKKYHNSTLKDFSPSFTTIRGNIGCLWREKVLYDLGILLLLYREDGFLVSKNNLFFSYGINLLTLSSLLSEHHENKTNIRFSQQVCNAVTTVVFFKLFFFLLFVLNLHNN